MLDLKVGLSDSYSVYVDRGCFDQDAEFSLRESELSAQRRDDFTCQYCGFQSLEYQVCIGDVANGADGLTTCCIFCEQTLHLDKVVPMRSGVLIWLPELGQAELNSYLPEMYLNYQSNDAASRSAARDLLDRLMKRREKAKAHFGDDDPKELVKQLKDAGSDRASLDRSLSDGLRLLSLDRRIRKTNDLEFNQFPQIMNAWRSETGPFAHGRARKFDQFQRNLIDI